MSRHGNAENDLRYRLVLEAEFERARATGERAVATRAALDLFGSEIFAFLQAHCRETTLATDAFADFAEDLWRGVSDFRGDSQLRTWVYTLARHAGDRQLRRRQVDQKRLVPLADAPEVESLIAQARNTTREYLRSEVKTGFRRLIEALPPEDQTLLHLRLYATEKLSWIEIAKILHHSDANDELELSREAPRLRKRYERLITKLKQLAKDQGLVD